jgi:hypothetical protein
MTHLDNVSCKSSNTARVPRPVKVEASTDRSFDGRVGTYVKVTVAMTAAKMPFGSIAPHIQRASDSLDCPHAEESSSRTEAT